MKKDTLTLAKALRLDRTPPPRVAFVGAGGKTTALFQAARELAPCIVTTTTHLGAWQAEQADQHVIIEKPEDVNQLEEIAFSGVILVTGAEEKKRLKALAPEELHWLEQFCNYHSLPLLIEADGARGKALKAPKAHEPAIPDFVDTVVVVAGLSGIGKNLDDKNVYNAKKFGELGIRNWEKWQGARGKGQEKIVTAEVLASVLADSEGGLKNILAHARKIALLNQADTPELQSIGGKIAKELISPRSKDFSPYLETTKVVTTRGFDAILISSLQPSTFNLQTFESTAAIILAAGSSSRFGQPKQLLDYHGKPFIRVVAETALKAELDPIVVVTGAEHDKISAVLADLPVNVVQNPNWADGQSSSIQVGVENLAPPPRGLRGINPPIGGGRVGAPARFFVCKTAAAPTTGQGCPGRGP